MKIMYTYFKRACSNSNNSHTEALAGYIIIIQLGLSLFCLFFHLFFLSSNSFFFLPIYFAKYFAHYLVIFLQ